MLYVEHHEGIWPVRNSIASIVNCHKLTFGGMPFRLRVILRKLPDQIEFKIAFTRDLVTFLLSVFYVFSTCPRFWIQGKL